MKREVNKMKIEKDFKVFFADIWSTKAEPTAPDGTKLPRVEKPKDVVILLTDKEPIDEEYPDLFVAPISTETELACDRDLLLSADDVCVVLINNDSETQRSRYEHKANTDEIVVKMNLPGVSKEDI